MECDTQNCWNKNKCSDDKKKNCEIFLKGSGKECHFNNCPLEDCEYAKKYGGCLKCPWFSKSEFMKKIGKPEILNGIKSDCSYFVL